ncbi:MAG TPA: O-antigen ligase family protein, partial [Verrucomicrobiae bacterium]|nr:O-antigen ligase family protein [Verrucomicrobiae bacterium]
IGLALTLGLLFYFEGLMTSRYLPMLLLGLVLTGAAVIPFSNSLPLSVQRSLTFLPLNLDPEAVRSAEDSTNWRLEMWKDVLPQVPQYLVLGKGLKMDAADLAMLSSGMNAGGIGAAGSELAGDYHSGPLSLIIPFGLFGVAGFIWFYVAGFCVLHRNYKFGDPIYERINRFLLVSYLIRIFTFLFVFGSFYSDMLFFIGPIALSIALNGGVRKAVEEKPDVKPAMGRLKLAGATR